MEVGGDAELQVDRAGGDAADDDVVYFNFGSCGEVVQELEVVGLELVEVDLEDD